MGRFGTASAGGAALRPVDYVEAGWQLCALYPRSKRPRGQSWQVSTMDSEWWDDHPEDGVGLIHGGSGTCVLDVDDLPAARAALARIGFDLDAELGRGVQIASGRPDRAKLLFRRPETAELRTHQVRGPSGVVYELRAGSSMDVLPPSIHPDTGKPYQWIGDPFDLPMLPRELLTHWLALDQPRDSKTYRPRQYEGDGRIIGRFCEVADMARLLESKGYEPHGTRWLSPHSTSGTPGVVLLPESPDGRERVYCHHGSDPLADGYSHDVFSVFCVLEHGGDVISAVRSAALEVGETEEDAELARSLDVILARRAERVEPAEKVAEHLGPIPVACLALLHDHFTRCVDSPKTAATLQATLAVGCMLAGRAYTTKDGRTFSAWFGVTDSSFVGHASLKEAVETVCYELGHIDPVRSTPFGSATQVYTTLAECPRALWVTGALGSMIRRAPRQTSDAYQGALSTLIEATNGRALMLDRDTGMGGKARRTAEERRIARPQLVVLAFLSHSDMGLLSSAAEYDRGMPQILSSLDAGDALGDVHSRRAYDVPDEIRAALSRLRGVVDAEGTEVEAMPVVWTADADAELRDLQSRMRESLNAERYGWLRGCVRGYTKTAATVASMLSVWRSPQEPIVDRSLVQWSGVWIRRCLADTVVRLAIAPESEQDDVMQVVHYALHNVGDEGLSMRELVHRIRRFKRLASASRESLLAEMIDLDMIERVDRGRGKAYRAIRAHGGLQVTGITTITTEKKAQSVDTAPRCGHGVSTPQVVDITRK